MDRGQRDYHFMKLGPSGWEALANGGNEEKNPHVDEALRKFLSGYGLPEFQSRLHPLAVNDLALASKSGRMPRWVLGLLTPDEVKAMNEVR